MPLKPLSDPVTDETMARVGEVVLVCRCSDGEYRRVKTDDEGRFVVAGGAAPGGGGDVTVLNWPVTQNVAGSVDVGNWPAGFLAQVTDWPSSQAVTGAFWQSVQPVSGTFWQATQPVSGTFWQATQPVSIAAPVAVTGSFWQATQPVSLASPVAVTGTFWQATQPVSGPLTDAQIRAAPLPVTGSFSAAPQASTLCVPATANISLGVTASLPAVVGQFHYITAIDIVSYAGAAIATAAGAVTITTTNLPGNPAFNHQRLHSAGQSFQSGMRLAGNPLKSAAAGVATTVVCPVLTGCIWRVTVTYYTGP